MMPSLLDLPPELLEQIILVLANEKPLSAKFLHQEPSDALLRSGYHPLKDLSQACRVTRELCFPSLFSTVKVDLNDVDSFLEFSKSHSLSSLVDSLLLYLEPNFQSENFNNCNIWLPMVRIIDSTKPSTMTALLTASLFEKILPYDLYLSDQWAFGIRYQLLQLKMPWDLTPWPQTSRETLESQNIFRLRKWTHCIFNQGSSINGYSSYEYFAKQPPSIFIPRDRLEFGRKMAQGLFENLISLDYIAIFPIDHMTQFCLGMKSMKKLKCLRVQLAPTPSNDVLDNPTALGKCQPADLWQEFEACYSSLAHFASRDWHIESTSMKEFVSLDYVNPTLRELLDRVVGQHLVNWEFDSNGGRWIWQEGISIEIDQ